MTLDEKITGLGSFTNNADNDDIRIIGLAR